ncbi:transcriptional regulator with XRE-family HTH domain [Pectinatus brassicae]|uniref:Transcriptional regulator with XRE-family HTH domain n=2 Tax=Pectinatus brassicae TaxID=862415 RepID=A0A840USC0_9FIRM|nr:transcriptional regulator with XRE-family HTH domain [Pectinatus brassicae]
MELFGKKTIIPTFEMGNYLQFFCNELGNSYTPKSLIQQHTIFPFYAPFLPQYRQVDIRKAITLGNGQGVYNKLGIIAGSICVKKAIYYCPMCASTEIATVGEPYIHREHQLQGVVVCPHHSCDLKAYDITTNDCSRIEYVRLEENRIDLSSTYCYKKKFNGLLWRIAKAAYYLLTHHFSNIEKKNVLARYKNLLYQKDLLTNGMRVRQANLHDFVVGHYGKPLLMFLESNIDRHNEYNWLRIVTRDIKRTVHPLRHILLILLLSGNMDNFFRGMSTSYNPFGAGPWPCLNQAAEHYQQAMIEQVIITADSKTRRPVGTFTCKCGYCYSRTGPDQSEKDRYRKGRIKVFGAVWERKLRELLQKNDLSYRKMARILGCDVKTVQKFEASMKNETMKEGHTPLDILQKQATQYHKSYKQRFQQIMREQPELSRTEIRKICPKEYMFLYRHDQAWLMKILPIAKAPSGNNGYIDWQQRDLEILVQLQRAYSILLQKNKIIRICKSSLGKQIAELSILNKKKDKLPLSQAFIARVTETTQQFQIRRCQQIIKEMHAEGIFLPEWKVWRKAGLRHKDYNLIKNYLNWNSSQGGIFTRNDKVNHPVK